jgi:serine/threonine protein phosphatase PrpC
MKFSVFQLSRKGGRETNEDRMGYCYTRGSGIFLVADGMGGHPKGEVAAQLALETISMMYQNEAKPEIPDVGAFLTSALLAAHARVLRFAIEKGMSDNPRTTIVAVVLQDGYASWIHCGDSRLYLVREGELLVRTRDHSFSEQQQGAGATGPLNRNILFTCLGSPTKPLFDLAGPVKLQQGDKIMLCSDGLWGSLADPDIVYHLGQKTVAQAVPDLVDRALHKGGAESDNVTVMALEWETPDTSDSERSSISTDSISDGVFESTFQSDLSDSPCEDFDDDAIERSIAEINEAIRRTATKRG